MTCAECGAALPERAKFCLECGTPVADKGQEHELRKTVTLLFTDVTGSTVLGEQLDPEVYRDVMGRYFALARAAVERHGGKVEKFVGDAVLAVFGIPEVREDDALRAVRAAGELQAGLAALSGELEDTIGVRLQVRTGVNTGQVVAGPARAGGSFATGDAVNTAARLEQAAPSGEVLLGATTYDLVRDAVEVAPADAVMARGKAGPVEAYRLLRVRDAVAGRTRRFDTRLVGRERESRALLDTLDRAVELERGHLVTVLGPPGIGKSRLVADFVKDLGDRAVVVSGRCVSYGQGITYFPVVQLLREALHLQGDESTEITRHAIDSLLAEAPDRARVGDLLLAVLGKDAEPGSRDETFWAVRRAVEQLAARRPLVVAVDDLHWAEPTLLELIEHLRDEVRELPLLLVCQARPELLDTRPGWGGGTLNSVTFGLEPFTAEQTALSLGDLLDGPVSPDVAASVTDWAGGNPLFVEEAAGHLVERGLLERSDDGWALTGDLASAEVPATVAALLSARLDLLPPDERSLAERISIVGLEVTEEDAVVLAGGEASQVGGLLTALTRRDVLRRRRTEHGEVWAFKHILVRDAAYEALPKAMRAELHERYAEQVASYGAEAGAERAAFVAHHLDQALINRRALGRSAAELAPLSVRVAEALASAGEQARDRLDVPAATSLLKRAASITEAPRTHRRDAILRLLRLLLTSWQVGALDEAVEQFADLVGERPSATDAALLDLLRLWRKVDAGDAVDPALLLAAADSVTRHRDPDDQLSLSLVLAARIDAHAVLGQWSVIADLARDAREVGGVFEQRSVQIYSVAGCVHGDAPLSQLADLIRRLREVESRTPIEDVVLLGAEAIRWAAADDPRAQEVIDELLRLHQAGDHQGSLVYASFAQEIAGDVPGAIRSLRMMAELSEANGDLSHESTHLGLSACLELERGDPDGVAPRLVERMVPITSQFDTSSVAHLSAAWCLLAGRGGDLGAVRLLGTQAVTTSRQGDQLWQTADIHRWVALAHRWCGDWDAERAHLEQALLLYRRKEIAYWTRWVEERLSETSQPR